MVDLGTKQLSTEELKQFLDSYTKKYFCGSFVRVFGAPIGGLSQETLIKLCLFLNDINSGREDIVYTRIENTLNEICSKGEK